MTTWLQRFKKMLATPPAGTKPGTPESPFQQRARELLQSESGANTLKELLLANKPEVGQASAQRRKLWERQLDRVHGVLHAFVAERSIEAASAARTKARTELSKADREACSALQGLEAERRKLAAELEQLQGRLGVLERAAADSEQALRREHEAHVTALRSRLADAVGADDSAAADALSAQLSAELRQEAERLATETHAPHPARLQAGVLRGNCDRKAAELAAVEKRLSDCQAELSQIRLKLRTVDYHEGLAAAMVALAQASAEGKRWAHDLKALGPVTHGRLDRLEFQLTVTEPEFVPLGERIRTYRPDASRWPVDGDLLDAYMMPLYLERFDLETFEKDTTRKWPDEVEFERVVAAERAAEEAKIAQLKANGVIVDSPA